MIRFHRLLRKSFLLLFVVAGCYEPADLTPVDEVEIPCVYCVLPTSWYAEGYVRFPNFSIRDGFDYRYKINEDEQECKLKLCYLKPTGKAVRYEDNARIILEVRVRDTIRRRYPFTSVGEGNYSMPTDNRYSYIEPSEECHLRIFLPNGDSLTAIAAAPPRFFSNSPGTYDPLLEPYARLSPETMTTEFELDGETYAYERIKNGNLYEENERTAFVLPAIDYPIWAYKVSYSGYGKDDWFVEEDLTTDLESRVDSFNQTGKTYQGHTLLPGEEAYPELLGRPLHHRYLRFSPSPRPDTLMISGNFSGYHYGCSGTQMQTIYKEHFQNLWDKIYNEEPYAYNIITNGRAGYIVFKIVSPEYDRYLKEVAQYELGSEVSTDIIGIYRNTNTYTNIKGGVGIFALETIYRYYWTNGTWNL